MVNFMGTFVSAPIKGLEEWGDEVEIEGYKFVES